MYMKARPKQFCSGGRRLSWAQPTKPPDPKSESAHIEHKPRVMDGIKARIANEWTRARQEWRLLLGALSEG